jgi:hypothetical protein
VADAIIENCVASLQFMMAQLLSPLLSIHVFHHHFLGVWEMGGW